MAHDTPHISATHIKNRFGHYLGQALAGRAPVIIERHGRPIAVLASMATWETARNGASPPSAWGTRCRRMIQTLRKNRAGKSRPSAVQLVRSLREEV